jgi:hypothetical protein
MRSKSVRRLSEVTALKDATVALAASAGVDVTAAVENAMSVSASEAAPSAAASGGGSRSIARFKRAAAAVVTSPAAVPATLAGKLAAVSVSVNPPRATSAIAATDCEVRTSSRAAPPWGPETQCCVRGGAVAVRSMPCALSCCRRLR